MGVRFFSRAVVIIAITVNGATTQHQGDSSEGQNFYHKGTS